MRACPNISAVSSRALAEAQTPKASGLQALSKGAMTMAPWLTVTRTASRLTCVTKSVPLTPMATKGVLRRKRSLAAWAAAPEIERASPASRLRRTTDKAGFAGEYLNSWMRKTELGRTLTRAPSMNLMCTWPLSDVRMTSPS